jgi:DNA-binding MarR family transcriptional regulator
MPDPASKPDPVSKPLRKQLCFAIYSASHAFTRAYRALLEPLGLTYPQYLVMLVLWERDGMRVKEIGAELYLDSGTLTPLLKRLEGLGIVRRVRDASDERQVTILLTETGRALEHKAASVPRDLECLIGLDNDGIGALIERIAKLRANLQAIPDEWLASA